MLVRGTAPSFIRLRYHQMKKFSSKHTVSIKISKLMHDKKEN